MTIEEKRQEILARWRERRMFAATNQMMVEFLDSALTEMAEVGKVGLIDDLRRFLLNRDAPLKHWDMEKFCRRHQIGSEVVDDIWATAQTHLLVALVSALEDVKSALLPTPKKEAE